MISVPDLRAKLHGAALRTTRPRLTVLAAVHAAPHADTDTLLREARRALPTLSHQTVYDVLRALTGAGLIRRIHPAGSVARYEARAGDNHHHLVCRSCGVIVDVDCAVGVAPCLIPADDHAFSVDEAEVVYWGRCSSCSTDSPTDSPTDRLLRNPRLTIPPEGRP